MDYASPQSALHKTSAETLAAAGRRLSKGQLHTWSKAAVMSPPVFPDVESSHDDRQSPQASHSMPRAVWRPETSLHPEEDLGYQAGQNACSCVG